MEGLAGAGALRDLAARIRRPLRGKVRAGLHATRQARLSLHYLRAVRARRARYAGAGFELAPARSAEVAEAAKILDRQGCVILRNVFPAAGLRDVVDELERAQRAGRLLPVARGTAQKERGAVLAPEEIAQGDDYLTTQAHILYVRDPFVECPSALRYVFSDLVIDLATAAYGCPPMLVAGKVMKSFCNDLPRFGFYNFHRDAQSIRLIKFFLYLNDVTPEGGPFCYVEGSHRQRQRGWRGKEFWSDAEIEGFYGKDRIRYLAANAGDVVVANTVGLHKACKPRDRRRLALLITTGVHEIGSLRLRAADLQGLTPRQRVMADAAELI